MSQSTSGERPAVVVQPVDPEQVLQASVDASVAERVDAEQSGAVEAREGGHTSAAVVLIGNELLSGKVEDRNGPFVVRALRRLGVTLRSLCVVPDDEALIAEAVSREAARCDVVFTSGGVGPTHDDVTMAAVAGAFGVAMVTNEALRDQIERDYGGDASTLSAWMKMSQVPEGSNLLVNGEVRWPVFQMRNVYILPGSPENFQRQFNGIRDRFHSQHFETRSLYLRLDEGQLAARLQKIAGRFPGVMLGSYPVLGHAAYRVRVTLESKDHEIFEAAYRALLGSIDRHDIYKVVDD